MDGIFDLSGPPAPRTPAKPHVSSPMTAAGAGGDGSGRVVTPTQPGPGAGEVSAE